MKSLVAGILLPGALGGVACRSNSTSPAEPPYSASSLSSAGIGDGRVGFGFNGTLSGCEGVVSFNRAEGNVS